MADIEILKQSRRVVKGKLTRFKTHLDNARASGDISELDFRLEIAKKLLDQFNEAQDAIEQLPLEPNSRIDQETERETFVDSYYRYIAEANLLLNANNTTQSESMRSAQLTRDVQSENMIAKMILPTIELPKFNGAYENWQTFYDTFKALIDSNKSLSKVQKFYYLIGALQGQAKEVVSSIENTSDNYDIALELLKRRFENKRLTIHHHVQTLFDLPPIRKETELRYLFDTFMKHFKSLENLGEPTNQWDTLLIYLITSKFDIATKRDWESKAIKNKWTRTNELIEFLTVKCQTIEATQAVIIQPVYSKTNVSNYSTKQNHRTFSCVSTNQTITCPMCHENHRIYTCGSLMKLSVSDRIHQIKCLNLCINCLGANHVVKKCFSRGCKYCNKKHHSLLHLETINDDGRETLIVNPNEQQSNNNNKVFSDVTVIPDNYDQQIDNEASVTMSACMNDLMQIMLSTAVIWVLDNSGKRHEARVLLDSGSQSNFISTTLCNKLNLTTQRSNTIIQSKLNTYSEKLSFLVLNNITQNIPIKPINSKQFIIPENVILADPYYNIPQKIDLLLGAEVFWDLLGTRRIKVDTVGPILQETQLGWILGGPYRVNNNQHEDQQITCGLITTDQLHNQLEKFWRVEECDNVREATVEEQLCEEHFRATYKRTSNGRFQVHLPFKGDIQGIGESKVSAARRLNSIEKKFKRSPSFKENYINFMNEYESLNHMSEVQGIDADFQGAVYLPHHGVEKESSLTTKLRVVFDASNKTALGCSLNDVLMVGPTIQSDLFSIVIRFRQHKYVMTADVNKMYRMIEVTPEHRDFQRILWRKEPSGTIKTYRLNTVTYGTAPAPFLAVRCLYQLAEDYNSVHPEASNVIKNDFYVDDLLTGGNELMQLEQLKNDIVMILESAHFKLHKWNSNHPALLNKDVRSPNDAYIVGEEIKTLGLTWHPTHDSFRFQVNLLDREIVTKRQILSIISQIYDPLGLVGPVTIKAKLLLQHLWLTQTHWDKPLPSDLQSLWREYQTQFPKLNQLIIPRQVLCDQPQKIELHAFCDASERAYGACVYMRSTNKHGEISTQLLCAKSKVAPLKKISLPRLELSGALVLATLCNKVKHALTINVDREYYWCDSTITLAWIRSDSSRWKTFVSNRVTEVQKLTHKKNWRHVKSTENPADIISRGTEVDTLKGSQLWWQGPDWLQREENEWPCEDFQSREDIPEQRNIQITLSVQDQTDDLFEQFSSLNRLRRIVALCLRFKTNSLSKKTGSKKRIGNLSVEELKISMNVLLRSAQQQIFTHEIRDLKNNTQVYKNSKLFNLSPFLDQDDLIRIGGRLTDSSLPFQQKHPIILPSKHKLTELIIRDAHYKQLHAGALSLLANIREHYWIISARRSIRRILRNCVVCFRVRPKSLKQLMGALPTVRTTPARPFTNVGLDYAGPFSIKISRNVSGKAYLCLFVCMVTKAIHLEVVSSLTTEAFLNTFKRFISRRGKPTHVYSDNGTTFVGAGNELRELGVLLSDSDHRQRITRVTTDQDIEWHFIPPHSPHMGGLWEANVKSAKTHLKTVVGTTLLTFEELYTMFTLIEACLNSRPLTPLSTDPQDLLALTPGHFLIGSSLMALPDKDLTDMSLNRLNRYQLLTRIQQDFWKRWSREYVTQLQERSKWAVTHENTQLIPGAMIVIKEDNVPPLSWRLGRIVEMHPGRDGLVRVVSIRTQNGITKRPINKVCILPIN